MSLRSSFFIGLVLAAEAFAQAPLPSFEVATIKPAPADGSFDGIAPQVLNSLGDSMRYTGGPGSNNPDRINYRGVTLKSLLQRAYDVKPDQIAGPSWLGTERYDIVAKLPSGATSESVRLMLQGLLAERFQISLHRETKALSVYQLTVAKGGPKLRAGVAPPGYKDEEEKKAALAAATRARMEAVMAKAKSGERGTSRRGYQQDNGPMAKLVEMLSGVVNRPVRDNTRLSGLYLIDLEWDPADAPPVDGSGSGPTLFAALEDQLGLKLQAVKEDLDVLVIDKGEKTPTSN